MLSQWHDLWIYNCYSHATHNCVHHLFMGIACTPGINYLYMYMMVICTTHMPGINHLCMYCDCHVHNLHAGYWLFTGTTYIDMECMICMIVMSTTYTLGTGYLLALHIQIYNCHSLCIQQVSICTTCTPGI